jgi:hypothetical protein
MPQSSLFKEAMRILERHRIWWDSWDAAREHAHAGNLSAAKKHLVKEHELKPEDADLIVGWLKERIHGQKVKLVEIPVSSIRWPHQHQFIDAEDSDPFESKRYLARRGVEIGYMQTSGSAEDQVVNRKVYFQNKQLDPAQLDQVWEVVPID